MVQVPFHLPMYIFIQYLQCTRKFMDSFSVLFQLFDSQSPLKPRPAQHLPSVCRASLTVAGFFENDYHFFVDHYNGSLYF